MIKKIVCFLLFVTSFVVRSQSFYGLSGDNYIGVQSVLSNPASIVDSRLKSDVNLFAISTAISSNLYGVSLQDALKKGYDIDKQSNMYATTNNSATTYIDIMGPSFMLNIKPKHSIAVFTRLRGMLGATGVNGKLINELKNGLSEANDFNLNVGSPNFSGNVWAELGLSYATVLLNKNQHFLKGGLSAKYIYGGYNSYVQGQGVSALYTRAFTSFNGLSVINPLLTTFETKGTVTAGASNSNSSSSGYGLDLGFIYEWRPDYEKYDLKNAKQADNNFKSKNKYKLRFGLAITDIGSMVYKNINQDVYNLNYKLNPTNINNIGNVINAKEYTYTRTITDIRAKLPTTLRLDLDWNIARKFYLNVNGAVSTIDRQAINAPIMSNNLIITPRFETKRFGFYLPVNYLEYRGLNFGTGLRLGMLFIGSSSVITNMVSKDSRAIDIYMGLKFSVYQGTYKDADGDDILDKNDKCPKESGPIENGGCPWEDTDKDGVLDKDDLCPSEKGVIENKGCPWEDTDKDGVLDKDDLCPKETGPNENDGCPWPDTDKDGVLDKDDLCPSEKGASENDGCPMIDSDGDGILDEDDKCPKEAGLIEFFGCPEVTEKMINQLDLEIEGFQQKKNKLSLKKEEAVGRINKMTELLNIYVKNTILIAGYTESVASDPKEKNDSVESLNKLLQQWSSSSKNVKVW